MKISLFLLLAISLSTLSGRDNPFMPKPDAQDIPIANNYIKPPEDFKKVTFKLPESARILDYIEVIYQNVDGSISREKVSVDKSINWKKKLTLLYDMDIKRGGSGKNSPKKSSKKSSSTQTITTKTVKKRVSKIVDNRVVYDKEEIKREAPVEKSGIKDEILVTHNMKDLKPLGGDAEALEKNKDGVSEFDKDGRLKAFQKAVSQNSAPIYSPSSIWGDSNPPSISGIKDFDAGDKKGGETSVSLGKPRFSLFEFFAEDNTIKISTGDKKKRHFMLVRPNRIVIDFYREVNFPNQTFDISQGVFKEMKLSKNGSDSYRITVFIESGYRYKLSKTEQGYQIKCYER
jgi:hypothetical protein